MFLRQGVRAGVLGSIPAIGVWKMRGLWVVLGVLFFL
jgi:hypothetical protein